jgi:hypothetical protein
MKLYSCMDALLDEMEDFVRERYGRNSASWRSGDFTAGALLEFKGLHGDGRLHDWTVGDVREFLLVWFPRSVCADEELRHDVPDCATAFFRFMAARGSLTGDPLCELEAACNGLRGQFLSSCRDPRRWNAGKVWLSLILAGPPAWANRLSRRRHTRSPTARAPSVAPRSSPSRAMLARHTANRLMVRSEGRAALRGPRARTRRRQRP